MRISHIEVRIEQQLALMSSISEAYDNLVKDGIPELTSPRIQARITILKDTWEKFSIVHEAIGGAIRQLNDEEQMQIQHHVYFSENYYLTTRESYVESLERMSSLLDSDRGTSQRSSCSIGHPDSSLNRQYSHQAKLPRLDLPKFSGISSDWLAFKDLFTSLVSNNPSLSLVEKLQYLKTSLTGSASLLLKNTALTANNFQKSWDSLIEYYENKRLLVDTSFQSLFNLRPVTKGSAVELELLYTNLIQIYQSFVTLDRPVSKWDDFLVFIATQKLDAESVKAWELHLGSTMDPPTWKQFCTFLFSRLNSRKVYEKRRQGKDTSQPSSTSAKAHYHGKTNNQGNNSFPTCSICSAQHSTAACSQYSLKTYQQKMAVINKHKLCYNCLGKHRVAMCRITKRCQKCGRRHHTSIHSNQNTSKETKSSEQDKNQPSSTPANSKAVCTTTALSVKHNCVLLATVQVRVFSPDGNSTTARALIDQGSEVSLISERLVQRLHLHRRYSSLSLIGVGATHASKTKGLVTFDLKPHFDSDFKVPVTAHILKKLTSSLPSAQMDVVNWPHLDGLQLADPQFFTPDFVDMILGADLYAQILEEGLIKGTENTPIAQNTSLGWILSGPIPSNIQSYQVQVCHASVQEDIYQLMHRFWELEEISTSTGSSLSPDEQNCEQHYETTYSRNEEGRYIVKLPFKQSIENLGSSKGKAILLSRKLKKRLESDPKLSKMYTDFLEEYAELQHMLKVPQFAPEPDSAYYLPHHGVLRESSLTTKLRVVFNGSSKISSGFSLNDLLHTGPKLQTNLFDVLTWFRQFRYVFSTDMEKMYRQIQVHPDDRKFQRIIWIDKDDQLSVYELTTVTYGLACAPFLALRSLIQLVKDEGSNFPLAVLTLTNGRYVDDIFGGADSIEQTTEIVKQVIGLCMAGGFRLQKWMSNEATIIEPFTQNNQPPASAVPFEDGLISHILGLTWQPNSDVFKFMLRSFPTEALTKRIILSIVAKIFDPLGFLSPIIIQAKILMQELWILKTDWDDPLPDSVSSKWSQFVDGITELPHLSFPRWLGFTSDQHLEIYGFSDASSQAFSAVIYSRSTSQDGTIYTQLVCSKTKVAPLKKLTIPRLELAGAALLTRLVQQVTKRAPFNNVPVFMWTDSMITHVWINNHPSRWKDFVRNRVCSIQETLPKAKWGFVPGIENPADLATRGLTPKQLSENSVWWKGPQWLSMSVQYWPQKSPSVSQKETLEERPSKAVMICVKPKECWDLLQKYSSLTKLFRITAVCKRIFRRLKREPFTSMYYPITTTELQDSKTFWVKQVQRSAFHTEILLLENGTVLSSTNNLTRLTPFLDSNGILRVGGRLQASLLSYEAKHPAILPKNSFLSSLIITDSHLKTLHGGTQVTLYSIREEFWIIGGRTPVKRHILKCVKCSRFRQTRAQQLMGQLPKERVTPSRPFLNSGVDYAGTFSIKTWRGFLSRCGIQFLKRQSMVTHGHSLR